MEITVCNPQKGRYETIEVAFTDENTTWFDECEDSHGIFSITDLQKQITPIRFTFTTYPERISAMTTAEQEHYTDNT
jgi:hypothetical protein